MKYCPREADVAMFECSEKGLPRNFDMCDHSARSASKLSRRILSVSINPSTHS